MRRTTALFVALLAVAAVTTLVLFAVIDVVFFALTVAFVAIPVFEWFESRGLPAEMASALTTGLVFVAVGLLFLPLATVLYVRRNDLFELIESLPDEWTVSVVDFSVTLNASDVQVFVIDWVQTIAFSLLSAAPSLAFQLALFALVVYGVLLGKTAVYNATYAVVPRTYHDVIAALEGRARATLWAIYVLQAATAVATFLLALPVFYLLGYEPFIALAVVAGILQFLPIVGPSVLIGAIALFHVSQGDFVSAILIAGIGGATIVLIPDLYVRPRLASYTAKLPGSLYFIGFIGGLLSVGPIGVIAGPLAVALLVELVDVISEELRDPPATAEG